MTSSPIDTRMSAEELSTFLAISGLSQVGLARILLVDDRTIRKWLSGDAPILPVTALAIRYLALPRNARALRRAAGSRA